MTSRPSNEVEICYVCGSEEIVEIKCKRVCRRCGHIIENCSGD